MARAASKPSPAAVGGIGPVCSMTGFGRGRAESRGVSARVEIRSINGRSLKLSLSLPPSAPGGLEDLVGRLVRAAVPRGTVSVGVELAGPPAVGHYRFDERVVGEYLAEWHRLGRALGLKEDRPGLAELAALPGALAAQRDERDEAALLGVARRATAAALADLSRMRATEGRTLARELARYAGEISRAVQRIAQRRPQALAEYRERLRRRVAELLAPAAGAAPGALSAPDEAALAREIVFCAERSEIAEELGRLASHLDQLAATLAAGGEVGKRLDFLAQELQREANTIGSKASDAEIQHEVVGLKSLIEKIREQVQNLE